MSNSNFYRNFVFAIAAPVAVSACAISDIRDVGVALCDGESNAVCDKVNSMPTSLGDFVKLGKEEVKKRQAPKSDPDQLRVQNVLDEFKCPVGTPDGQFGPTSVEALRQFGVANPGPLFPAEATFAQMADILEARDDWNECSALPTSSLDQLQFTTDTAAPQKVTFSTGTQAAPALKM